MREEAGGAQHVEQAFVRTGYDVTAGDSRTGIGPGRSGEGVAVLAVCCAIRSHDSLFSRENAGNLSHVAWQ